MSFQEQTKYCPKCKKYHPESLFARDKKRPDGLYPTCKLCFRKSRRDAGDTTRVLNDN